jgi:RNA polymerase sigma-70 factor
LQPVEFMPKEAPFASLDQFPAQYARLDAALRTKEMCARWGLREEDFVECLRRSAEKRFGGARPDTSEVEAYLKSLHLEDLALACACSKGIERAWEFFIAHFRQDLRNAASAMLRGSGVADDARAEELADSLYAELYGVRSGSDGRRKSLFEYFHGRSKLSTWLRAVLAQKQVDMFRTSGRTVSLEAEIEGEAPRDFADSSAPTRANHDPDREKYLGRFDKALSAALGSLTARDRMILACYYVDRISLAEIGRLLREHESTVSRQLERIRRALRESVKQMLQREIPEGDGQPPESPLDAAQVELTFEYALEDWPFDLSKALSESEQPAETHRDEP